MYKAIIIDDEEMARTLLKGMVQEYCPTIEIVDLCKDLPNGVKSIRKYRPDIVFLDIEMPGHSGLELLDFFNEDEIDFSIIFVTAYNQYAIQAFKLSAVDYLLKPVEINDLKNAIKLIEKQTNTQKLNVLRENLGGSSVKKIALATSNSILFVEIDTILFFQADGSYTKVVLLDGKTLLMSKGLKHFENILTENQQFFRCHKSYLVNLKHVTEHIKSDGGQLKINDKFEVSLSADKVNDAYKLMDWIIS
jgi:two-component system LytT family response regulator